MDFTPLAQRAEQWALHRALERSTYIGLALVATNLGWPGLAAHITGLGDVAPAILATLGAGLVTASTSPAPRAPVTFKQLQGQLLAAIAAAFPPTNPPARPALADPAKSAPVTTKGSSTMSLLKIVRGILGIVATAIAPSWNKALADTFAQAEAALTPLLGDDAKKLAQDAEATGVSGWSKLASVVGDLIKIAADKGIKADAMVLTVIATKAVAQIKVDAPELLETAIDTAVTATAGPVVGAIAAPVVAGAVAELAPVA